MSNDSHPAVRATPPEHSFASDNSAGVSPKVMEALIEANSGTALAYGDDRWTDRAVAALENLFDRKLEVLFCWGGTGANVVGLGSILQPWQAAIAPESSHMVVDECGAPSRITGSTLVPVLAPEGKLTSAAVEPYLSWSGVQHHVQPRVLSISQATEMGTVYTVDELAELCEFAHSHGLLVHMDGARIANAVAALDVDANTLVASTGVDVMTFGITKNGAMYGEAVIFLNVDLGADAQYVRKQVGQLASKNRFVAAQVLALLTDDLWLDNALHANAMASQLADAVRHIPGVDLVSEPQVNSLFVRLPPAAIAVLQDWSFFWEWDRAQSVVRWMTSFMTKPEDISRFAAGVEEVCRSRLPA